MSLKAFHIVFVTFSTLLALGLGSWCVWVDLVEGAPIYRTGAIASFGAAILLFIYMWLPVSKRLYQRNPEHLANRVEVAGLFWHFVDLVWIFVFPLFYLL